MQKNRTFSRKGAKFNFFVNKTKLCLKITLKIAILQDNHNIIDIATCFCAVRGFKPEELFQNKGMCNAVQQNSSSKCKISNFLKNKQTFSSFVKGIQFILFNKRNTQNSKQLARKKK